MSTKEQTFGNETIGPEGRTSIMIEGLDGLVGEIKINKKEITLEVTEGTKCEVSLRRDGTVKANMPKGRNLPKLKFEREHMSPEGFKILLNEVRYSPTALSAYELFSDILGYLADDVLAAQRKVYENKNSSDEFVSKFTGLHTQEKNIRNLRIALMDSVPPSRQSLELINTPERQAELDSIVELQAAEA